MNRKGWSFRCSAALTVLNYQFSLLGCSYLIIFSFKKRISIWVVHLWPQVHGPSWSVVSLLSLGTLLMFSHNRNLSLVSRGSAVCWRKKPAMMRSGYSNLNVHMLSLRSERVLSSKGTWVRALTNPVCPAFIFLLSVPWGFKHASDIWPDLVLTTLGPS